MIQRVVEIQNELGLHARAAAKRGTRLRITFNGGDEEEAARETVDLIQSRFGEER